MRPLVKLSLHIAMLGVIASCSPIVDLRGHSSEQADFSQIVVGQSRSDDVQALLGSPSAKSSFGDKTWYYITEKKETHGMLAPEVVEQKVVSIQFDENDTVKEVGDVNIDASKPVEYVDKTTPTEGRTLTAIEQIMGNFGRFNTPGREINPRDMGR